MNGNSSYIGSDQLKTYTVDQVADWLCQVGFRDCTAKFLERNIDGKKLLDLQEFQLNNFILSDNKRKRAFWSLLESVRNNNQSNPPNSNMFSGGGGRLPPSRPPKSMPGFGTHNNGRVPPRRPPPNQTFEPMNPNLIHDVNYDSFSDGDDNYMDEVETLPPPKRRPRGPGQTPFRRSGEFGNFRLPMPSPHEARSFSVDFTNNPPPVGRKPRASIPNYTPVTLKNKAHMHPPGPPGNPPLPGRRPPARLPGDGPAIDQDDQDYLSFEEPPPPQGYHHSAPPPRPPAHIPIIPYSAEAAPPAIPGRSPMRSPYDDHQLPNRPPPLPPLAAPTSPPQAPLPKFSPLPHRSGSDKTDSSPHSQSPISFSSEITSHLKSRQGNISTESRDSGHGSPGASREPSWKSGNRLPTGHLPNRKHNSSTESRESGQSSPVASRGPSWKNQGFPIAHLPDRKNHASTGSNSSSGSDDLTKPPVTKDTFAGMKKDKLPKFPPTLHNKFHSTGKPTMPMPHFSTLPPPPMKTGGPSDIAQDLKLALQKRFNKANPDEEEYEGSEDIRGRMPTPNEQPKPLNKKPYPLPKQQSVNTDAINSPSRFNKPPILPHPQTVPVLPSRQGGMQPLINQMSHELVIEDEYHCIEIEDQPWFQDINRRGASGQIEKYQEDGMFIIRPREGDDEPYAMTVWGAGKIWNFIIRKRPDGNYALGTEKPNEAYAGTILKLVEYYQDHNIVLPNNNDTVKITRPPPT
ncbi:uncharacterized protein LOC120339857 isoform X4 [Styela clava]